jgi:Escherichia/Staphylococcus phage prohead protease
MVAGQMSRGMSSRDVEIRSTALAVELRGSAGSRAIGGYAAVFGKKSHQLQGGFVEIVEPRAFSKSEGDGWPGAVCRYLHDDSMLCGTTAAGTLGLSVDKNGLDYVVDLPESRSDVLELVQRGDVTASSFAFQTHDEDWSRDGNTAIRHLLSVRLIDVAPVTSPAYPDASVALRSLALQFDADPEDVATLARTNELRKLFTDTRGPRRTLSGRQALVELMASKPGVPQRKTSPTQARKILTDLMKPRVPHASTAYRRAELARLAVPYSASGEPRLW